jgi:hypothetical protein
MVELGVGGDRTGQALVGASGVTGGPGQDDRFVGGQRVGDLWFGDTAGFDDGGGQPSVSPDPGHTLAAAFTLLRQGWADRR